MGKGAWVKPAERVYAPLRWVSVVVRPRVVGRTDAGGGAWAAFDRATVVGATWRAGRWRRGPVGVYAGGPDALRAVESHAAGRKGTWVVSPDATAALTMLGAWADWTERKAAWAGGRKPLPMPDAATSPRPGVSGPIPPAVSPPAGRGESPPTPIIVQQLITRGNPTIVKYSVGGRSLTWVSASQYTPATAGAVAAQLGIDPPAAGGRNPDADPDDEHDEWQANVWLKYMCDLSDWWRDVGGGPWSATAGGLGMSFVRRRLSPKTVLSHDDDTARGIEERGLYGGRASVWCVAPVGRTDPPPAQLGPTATAKQYRRVPGPVELWDVRSMYPTILERELFPVRYVGILERPSPELLASAARDYLLIADVVLDTPAGEYPYRDGETLRFPAGQFRTVLPGPELAAAVAAGHVKDCIRAVTYRPGRPFALAATELKGLRRAAELEGNEIRASFVKMISNAYSGKMAQRKHDWVRRPDVAPWQDWGQWPEDDGPGRPPKWFRAAAGLVWEKVPHRHGGRPLAAVYAFLTSYGRQLMASVRAMLPARSVVSQDTDGLWVVGPGRERFTEVAQALERRGYTIVRKLDQPSGIWLGPRHYWTTGGWVLSGFHAPSPGLRAGTWSDTYMRLPPLGTSSAPPIGIETVTRDNLSLAIDLDGAADARGWITPRVIRPPYRRTDQSPPGA